MHPEIHRSSAFEIKPWPVSRGVRRGDPTPLPDPLSRNRRSYGTRISRNAYGTRIFADLSQCSRDADLRGSLTMLTGRGRLLLTEVLRATSDEPRTTTSSAAYFHVYPTPNLISGLSIVPTLNSTNRPRRCSTPSRMLNPPFGSVSFSVSTILRAGPAPA